MNLETRISAMNKEEKKIQMNPVGKITNLLAKALEQGPDPMLIADCSGKIVYVNKRFSEITGYYLSEILGQNPRILSAGKTPSETYWELWNTVLSGQVWEGELCNKKKDGQLFWEFISITPIKGEDGSVSHFVASFKDISDKKQMEEKLAKLAVDMERSNKELEAFAYVASHDLQEPLGIIRMHLELLQRHLKDKLDKDAERLINIAKEGAAGCQNLIRELLEYAKIGKNEKSFKMTDFESILRRALSGLELAVLESGAEITHGPLPKLMVDSSQMLRLFQNLLSNALKYRSDEPLKIHISARRNDQEWIFAVKDNGVGIAPKDKDRIFALFQRLHTKTDCPGTGIGLAVCKKIVEYHGGKIWLQSGNGVKGTTFYFSLPLFHPA